LIKPAFWSRCVFPAAVFFTAAIPADSLMDEMVISATRGEQELGAIPASISVVNRETIQSGRQQLTLDESLSRVPGLFLQNAHNFSQAQRISIRGFGARSPFGIRGIRLFVDGVPATLADGQGNVDEIDLGSTDRIEVIRGPASAMYGAAAGGVISVFTEEGPEKPYIEGRVSAGEFGFRKYQLKAGGRYRRLNYMVSGSSLDLDGFRKNSFIERKVLNSRLQFDIDDDSDLTVSVNLLDIPQMGDPGALTAAELANRRRAANPNSLVFAGGESRAQQRLGLVYRRKIGEKHEFTLRNHYTWLDFDNRLPFTGSVGTSNGGQVELDRFFTGGGAKYVYTGNLFGRENRLTAGIDADFQRDDRRRFQNLPGGARGLLTFDQLEEVTGWGLYLQNEWSLLEELEISFSVRYDEVDFSADDRFLVDNSGDDSGGRKFREFSPRAGLLWRPAEWANLYFTYSTSFETPTTTEFANPSGGGFNPDAGLQTADSFEFGVKGAVQGPLVFDYELVLFRIEVDGELVPFEADGFTGRTFFENAGSSMREGFEAALSAEPLPGLIASLAFSYLDARFERFRTAVADFDGNRIPGIPEQHLHAEIRYTHPDGWYGIWDLLHAGSFYADNANRIRNAAYQVAGLKLGYEKTLGAWVVAPFVSINNLFDEKYNSNVRINAGFGRFFEPAPGRNFFGGLSVRRNF